MNKFSEPTGLRSNLGQLADRVQVETPQPPVLGKEMRKGKEPGYGGLVFFLKRKVGDVFLGSVLRITPESGQYLDHSNVRINI